LTEAAASTESVLLAERNDFVVAGVREMLEGLFTNVFVVSDAHSLIEGAARIRPGVIVMDLATVDRDAAGLIRRLRSGASPAVIVLTLHDAPDVAKDLLDAGADGVVLKHRLAIELLAAVDTVLEHGRYVSSGIALKSLGSTP